MVVDIANKNKSNPKYHIRYFDFPDELFCSNLYTEYKNGEVELLPVCMEDFLDASILHCFLDETDNSHHWWKADVVDFDEDSNKENPDFFVLYTENSEAPIELEYFWFPLIEDYLNINYINNSLIKFSIKHFTMITSKNEK